MEDGYRSPKLINEEKKAIVLFLWLFNIIFFSYDIFYNYMRPIIFKDNPIAQPRVGLGIWLYVIFLGLIPLSIYLLKKGNPYPIKYLYIIVFILANIIDCLIKYLGTSIPFSSGNIVEILFILFSPIFVNKKYFWTVTLGMIGSGLFLWIVLQDGAIVFLTLIYIVLSIIAFLLLNRFDSYIDSLTTVYEELRNNERLAVAGQMASAVGHEIRNPLSSLKGFTQLQKESYPNTNDYYPIMIREIDRINKIVDDLLYLGKPRKINFEKESISEIIEYTLSITRQQAENQGVSVDLETDDSLPLLECDREKLTQVFINLIKKAIEAMPGGGSIHIIVKVIKGNKMSITIQDEGIGIAADHIPNLIEPFYTTKSTGTGLGLMVTNQIIKDHCGELKIESIIGKGTTILVKLPLYQGISTY